MYKRRNFKRILRPVPRDCYYCKNNVAPVVKDVEQLSRYISERGKILSHLRTGVCSKHQRAISLSIKHARHLALLPFINQV